MDLIPIELALFAVFLKTDPIYSFILDAFPLMIVSTFGAIVNQLNSDEDITKRSTLAGVTTAVALAIITNVVAREYLIKVHIQVLFALIAGLKGKQILSILSDKILAKMKDYNGK